MNAAGIDSPRLQRVLRVLERGGEHTTRGIMRRANVCAVNTCIAELREHGIDILCQRRGRYWYYWLAGGA